MKRFRQVKQTFLAYFLAYFSKIFIRFVLFTCRLEIQGLERFIQTAATQKSILMLWHNRLALVAEFLRKEASQFTYTAFVSKSRDGEPLAILAESYPFGRAIRVPHNARHQALKSAICQIKKKGEILIITPDGPRGPQYLVKAGITVAAKEAEASIIPFSWSANTFWELGTWDKMRIPKPFSKIVVAFGEPISPESFTSKEDLRMQLQVRMEEFCEYYEKGI
jgi:hypothetical protein